MAANKVSYTRLRPIRPEDKVKAIQYSSRHMRAMRRGLEPPTILVLRYPVANVVVAKETRSGAISETVSKPPVKEKPPERRDPIYRNGARELNIPSTAALVRVRRYTFILWAAMIESLSFATADRLISLDVIFVRRSPA